VRQKLLIIFQGIVFTIEEIFHVIKHDSQAPLTLKRTGKYRPKTAH
jgi:hypothetical protein